MQTSEGRVQWIDFARMLAIFCVVLCHAVDALYKINLDTISALSTQSRLLVFFSSMVGRVGVPLFFMITGYLLLDRSFDAAKTAKFWKRNWLHLLFCTWIWFAVYEIYNIIQARDSDFGMVKCIEDFLFINKVKMSHVWYMPVILGFYILIPFAANALEKFDEKMLVFPTIVFSVFAFGYPTLSVLVDTLNMLPLNNQFSLGFSGGTYGLYLIFGYLVKKKAFKGIPTEIVIAISILSFSLGVFMQLWLFSHGYVYSVWYDNLFVMVSSVSLFELTSRCGRIVFYPLVKALSYYSFPIYLIHNMIRYSIIDYIKQMPFMMPLKLILLWITCILFSLVIAMVINRIPKIGKYILYTK